MSHIFQKALDTYFCQTLREPIYSKKGRQILRLNDQNIKFEPKSENPPKTPEIRCIEDFWSIIKRVAYKDGWEAENLEQLKTRILYCFNKVDQECVQKLAEGT